MKTFEVRFVGRERRKGRKNHCKRARGKNGRSKRQMLPTNQPSSQQPNAATTTTTIFFWEYPSNELTMQVVWASSLPKLALHKVCVCAWTANQTRNKNLFFFALFFPFYFSSASCILFLVNNCGNDAGKAGKRNWYREWTARSSLSKRQKKETVETSLLVVCSNNILPRSQELYATVLYTYIPIYHEPERTSPASYLTHNGERLQFM